MIPLLWPGATVVCIACGPSLTSEDVDLVRQAHDAGRVRVIAINAAVRFAPWADVRYAHHAADWCRPEDKAALSQFRGLRYACEARAAQYGVTVLRMSGPSGLETQDRAAIRHGKNSGYQAMNVAVHLGARRVILLGYDLKRSAENRLHFYACNGLAGANDFKTWQNHYATLPGPLNAAGVAVVNATRDSALEVFPRATLEAALAA
jgi:hypothetical protein